MICPNCGNELKETTRQALHVDECIKCRGVWFDAGELDDYAAKFRGESWYKAVAEIRFVPDEGPNSCQCPSCQTEALVLGHVDELQIELCRNCHGIFLTETTVLSFEKPGATVSNGTLEVIANLLTALLLPLHHN